MDDPLGAQDAPPIGGDTDHRPKPGDAPSAAWARVYGVLGPAEGLGGAVYGYPVSMVSTAM
jgi:hypothetical protein